MNVKLVLDERGDLVPTCDRELRDYDGTIKEVSDHELEYEGLDLDGDPVGVYVTLRLQYPTTERIDLALRDVAARLNSHGNGFDARLIEWDAEGQ